MRYERAAYLAAQEIKTVPVLYAMVHNPERYGFVNVWDRIEHLPSWCSTVRLFAQVKKSRFCVRQSANRDLRTPASRLIWEHCHAQESQS